MILALADKYGTVVSDNNSGALRVSIDASFIDPENEE